VTELYNNWNFNQKSGVVQSRKIESSDMKQIWIILQCSM